MYLSICIIERGGGGFWGVYVLLERVWGETKFKILSFVQFIITIVPRIKINNRTVAKVNVNVISEANFKILKRTNFFLYDG